VTRRAAALAVAALTALSGCGLGPYRGAAIARVRESCNDQAVSSRDVTDEREAERRHNCERTHSTTDCTPISADARWVRTDACRHPQRWLCTRDARAEVTCEPDADAVVDETP
jgi:hypothetical protein